MKCPFCGAGNDKVVDSRSMGDGVSIRRRRECLQCNNRFTTYERIEDIPLKIIKRNQNRESYDRRKIAKGIQIACQKRPVSTQQIEEITDKIEHKLLSGSDREIPSHVIGEAVMKELSQLDQVAYVRFASVYRQFKDVNQFFEELSRMMEEKQNTSAVHDTQLSLLNLQHEQFAQETARKRGGRKMK